MKYYPDFERVIATKERSAGNDTVGDMWTETKSFNRDTPINKILEWAKDCSGKLIITIDEDTADTNSF